MTTNINGNILSPNEDKEKTVIVCHQVNCKGVMGAGLALQVKEKFPEVYNAYKERCDAFGDQNFGQAQFVSAISPCNYIVANLFGQKGYGRKVQQTDYDALRKAFEMVHEAFPNGTIRIPYRIGCGLAGGSWLTVSKIIDEVFADSDVEIWHYN